MDFDKLIGFFNRSSKSSNKMPLFKKWRVSSAKLCSQLIGILDIILGYVDEATEDDFKNADDALSEAYCDYIDNLTTLSSKLSSMNPIVLDANMRDKKKIIFVDGFIMEGKTEYCENLFAQLSVKSKDKVLLCDENSDMWRLVFNDKGDCLLNMSRNLCGIFHYFNTLSHLIKAEEEQFTTIVFDRSPLSSVVFNKILMDGFFKHVVLANFNVGGYDLHLLRSEVNDYPWPLYSKRKFETSLYNSVDNLVKQRKLYYDIMDLVIDCYFAQIGVDINYITSFFDDKIESHVDSFWIQKFNDFIDAEYFKHYYTIKGN